jgi:hypothetical protein
MSFRSLADTPKKNLILLHWFLCSVGLIGILYGISRKLHAAVLSAQDLIVFQEWAIPFFNPNKPQELIFFIGAGISLFLYYGIVAVLITKHKDMIASSFGIQQYGIATFISLYFLLPVLINALVFLQFPSGSRPSMPSTGYLLGILWLVVLLLPLGSKTFFKQLQRSLLSKSDAVNVKVDKRLWSYTVMAIFGFVCIQFVMVFLPFTMGSLLMMNEYWDIPEYTRMGNRYVSSAQFFREHNIGGLLKYEPDSDHGRAPFPRPGMSAEVPKTLLLEQFIARHRTNYYYRDETGALVIRCAMSPEERQELDMVFEDPEHQAKINGLYFASSEPCDRFSDVASRAAVLSQPEKGVGNLTDHLAYTAAEEEFLAKNYLELRWQILNRWVLHHHNFVLGPINEYALGKPLQEINAQYGVFNVVLMRWLLEKTGGISYQNYFQKWYAWWLVYYALFVMVVWVLFRNLYYVALVCILAFGLVNRIDYQFLFLGPGYNPVRHFFDLPVIASLYWYLKTQRPLALVLTMAFGMLGIVNNREFGAFLVGALVLTVLLKAWQEREAGRHLEAGLGLGSAVASGFIYLAGQFGNDVMTSYYLKGFLGLHKIGPNVLGFGALIISGCYIVLVRANEIATEWKYLAFFFLVYLQGLFLYGIWHGSEKHFLSVGSIVVLGAVIILKVAVRQTPIRQYEKVMVTFLIAVSLMVVYVPGVVAYYKAKGEYERVFETHQIFEWNLERARFRSTMDPEDFAETIRLVQRYAADDKKIYIISKYDNVLPFLAEKYSAMPFFDVQWFLLTDKEVRLCIEAIEKQKPPYLFVDTDIERTLNDEILTEEIPRTRVPKEESRWRVQRLNLLRGIFAAVKDDYEPVEKGLLLTAYKRKSHEVINVTDRCCPK